MNKQVPTPGEETQFMAKVAICSPGQDTSVLCVRLAGCADFLIKYEYFFQIQTVLNLRLLYEQL